MIKFRALVCFLALALLTGAGLSPCQAASDGLMVFAAASTTNAVTEIGQAFTAQSKLKVVNSFASSSTLAKQLEQGAPAGVYISANLKWMDYLQNAKVILPDSRVNILRNRLVLIAPAASKQGPLQIDQGLDLKSLLAAGRLAMGDPSHVPAGIYGQKALASLGLWPKVKNLVAAAANVRAALALVESGEAPLGVVYATDAAISAKVKVVGEFPPKSHPAIVYPAALVAHHDSPAARAYLKFLGSPKAAAIFRKYGFTPY